MRGRGFWKHSGFGGLGFLHKKYMGSRRPGITRPVDCPERKEQVSFSECVICPKFQVWHEKDGNMKRCWYEYKDLKSKGWYEPGDEYLKHTDFEAWQKVQEEKREVEEVNHEMEAEKADLESRAEELEKKFPPSYFNEYYGLDSDGQEDEGEADLEDEDEDDEEF